MALSLNTGHALYPNLVALFAVDGGAIVDLKNPSAVITETGGTFTYGSGTYGEHIESPNTDGAHLVTDTPFLTGVSSADRDMSAFIVINNTASVSGGSTNFPAFYKYNATFGPVLGISDDDGNVIALAEKAATATRELSTVNAVTAGAYSAAATVSGLNNSNQGLVYVNGTLDGSTVGGTDVSNTTGISQIGSAQGFTRHTSQYVYWAFFDRVLTAQEVSDLHTSLGASNQFALVNTATGSITTTVKNNAGTTLVSQTGITADVYNISTGALVVRATGLTTDVSGVLVISDAAIVPATEYRVVISQGSADGVERSTAA